MHGMIDGSLRGAAGVPDLGRARGMILSEGAMYQRVSTVRGSLVSHASNVPLHVLAVRNGSNSVIVPRSTN